MENKKKPLRGVLARFAFAAKATRGEVACEPSKIVYCISSRIEKKGQLYGCFKIGPFLGHQSGTFATALRRTLLADTSRCTLNAIQIEGIEHEYSNLIGVRESVVDILLNLEKLTFQTAQLLTKPQVGFVNVSGPGILRAQHLHLPKGLKCVDPSQYLATLEIDGRLTFKLFFSPNLNQFARLKPIGLTGLALRTFNSISLFQFSKIKKRKKTQNHQSRLEYFFKSDTFNPLKKKIPTRGEAACKPGGLTRKRFLRVHASRGSANAKRLRPLGQLQKTKLRFFLKDNFHYLGYSKKKYLFLKNSLCSVEKAHYTLQSQTSDTFKSDFDYIFLEVWTNGTRHPKKAVFKAMYDILLDLYPYSLGQEQVPQNLQFYKPRNWHQKFLNLEISNFYFDLETYIFFKKKNIHRVLDLILFLKKSKELSVAKRPKGPEQGLSVAKPASPSGEAGLRYAQPPKALVTLGPSIPHKFQNSIKKFQYFIASQTDFKSFL